MKKSMQNQVKADSSYPITVNKHQRMITIVENKYSEQIPYFIRLGVGGKVTRNGLPNIYDLVQELPYNSIQLMFDMDRLKNTKTNVSIIDMVDKSDAYKRRIQRALPALIENNVIIKIGVTAYLLNPSIFIPDNITFDSILDLWVELGGKV